MKRKPKLYEDEPETVVQNVGTYTGYSGKPFTGKPKPQIGFIRQTERRKADVTRRRKNDR